MNSLKDKMNNYEVTPPANSWEKIAVALDEAHISDQFPSRIYNMKVVPPASAWEKIEPSLNKTTDTPFIAPVRRLSPWLRYAAAAVLVGIVALGITRFTMTNNTVKNSAQVGETKDSSTPLNNLNIAGSTTDADSDQKSKQEIVVEKNKTTLAKASSPVKRGQRNAPVSVHRRTNAADGTNEDLTQTLYAYTDHIPAVADRYVMFMTPDGNIIRMSKKWSELLCCVSGEEQDADCKDQLKKWQQKIASSELAPSPGNFMDILGLVNSLDENNGL